MGPPLGNIETSTATTNGDLTMWQEGKRIVLSVTKQIYLTTPKQIELASRK